MDKEINLINELINKLKNLSEDDRELLIELAIQKEYLPQESREKFKNMLNSIKDSDEDEIFKKDKK